MIANCVFWTMCETTILMRHLPDGSQHSHEQSREVEVPRFCHEACGFHDFGLWIMNLERWRSCYGVFHVCTAEVTADKWRMQAGSHQEPSTRWSSELSADISNDLGLQTNTAHSLIQPKIWSSLNIKLVSSACGSWEENSRQTLVYNL
jgi:hypothetical protein